MKYLVAALLVLIALIGAYFLLVPSPTDTDMEGETEGLEEVSVEQVAVEEETTTHAINVHYPQFGIATIDAAIKSDIDTAVSELKAISPSGVDSVVGQYTLDGSYESVYVGSDVISMKLILSQYTGGAHSLTLVSGVNFDRESGRRLGLDDALLLIGLSLEQLSARATAEFETKLGEAFFPDGANTNPENFSSFVISEDEVTFIFQQYQVASYAAGPQEVSFARVR